VREGHLAVVAVVLGHRTPKKCGLFSQNPLTQKAKRNLRKKPLGATGIVVKVDEIAAAANELVPELFDGTDAPAKEKKKKSLIF